MLFHVYGADAISQWIAMIYYKDAAARADI